MLYLLTTHLVVTPAPCPSGDDPWTANQVDEVQAVACAADSGSFTLSFRGETTRRLPVAATAAQVEAALESLRTYVRGTTIVWWWSSH